MVYSGGPESGGWDGGWSKEGERAGKVEVENGWGRGEADELRQRATSTSTMMPATSNGFHYDDVSALRDPDPNKPDVATYEPNPDPDYHHAATGAFRRRKIGCTVRLNHDVDVGDDDGQSWLQRGHEDGNNHHYHNRNQVVMTTTSMKVPPRRMVDNESRELKRVTKAVLGLWYKCRDRECRDMKLFYAHMHWIVIAHKEGSMVLEECRQTCPKKNPP
ncbi:hypothetical protein EDB89DRAFT_1911186 [Lactarius sanguifluus]|nr:hypothetical protein EDB89DRAFT_1911186 [Lactarius sanguifluus]